MKMKVVGLAFGVGALVLCLLVLDTPRASCSTATGCTTASKCGNTPRRSSSEALIR